MVINMFFEWFTFKKVADKLWRQLSSRRRKFGHHPPHAPHWKKDAALRLAGAVENDHRGRV